MSWFLLDIDANNYNKILIDKLDSIIFKERAFASKRVLIPNSKISYSVVLFKKIPYKDDEKFPLYETELSNKFLKFQDQNIDRDILYSIYIAFKDNLELIKNCSFTFLNKINDDDINIFYTDGSCKADKSAASFACCELLNEASDGLFDDFSEKNYLFNEYTGIIESGTNNVGELSGVNFAVKHLKDKKVQLIISDSEYSIKAFREWIWNWEQNGYKTYLKKPIQNDLLIKETREILKNSGKVVLYKWTKGHAKNSFNEKCDELAKNKLGIKK